MNKLRVRIVLIVDVDRDEYEINYGTASAAEVRSEAEERAQSALVESYARSGLPTTAGRVRVAEKAR
jgi:hypothetical protein